MSYNDPKFVNVTINAGGTLKAGTTYVLAFSVPTDDEGGGLTALNANFSSNEAIAAASAPNFEVVTLGTDSAIYGTVFTAIGSAAFGAGTPRPGTVSSEWVDVDAGHKYVAIKWIQTEANADIPVINASIGYIMGR